MNKYLFEAKFEQLVVAVIVSLPTKKVLVARMRDDAKNQLAGLMHFVGGPIISRQTPEESLCTHLDNKLYIRECDLHPLVRTQREGPLLGNDNRPSGSGKRYVSTDWFIVTVSTQPNEIIHVDHNCDLHTGSAHWSTFTDLLDERRKWHLRGVSLNRTPTGEIYQALNTIST
ncbi:MAG: hypothetical protein AAB774_00235 [Patescibacteria group bacterium]